MSPPLPGSEVIVPHHAPPPPRAVSKIQRRCASQAGCSGVSASGVASQKASTAGCIALTSATDESALANLPKEQRAVGETSAKQVFDRLAGTWTYWGWKGGYFDSEEDARAFFDEMRFMLAAQMAAPNSPQWFNTGLHWAYGIEGPPQGHHYVDPATNEVTRSSSAYERPAPHACFIQEVTDDLVNEGGIMDLWVREARIFKYGSGTGSNFSKLRGGHISGSAMQVCSQPGCVER